MGDYYKNSQLVKMYKVNGCSVSNSTDTLPMQHLLLRLRENCERDRNFLKAGRPELSSMRQCLP